MLCNVGGGLELKHLFMYRYLNYFQESVQRFPSTALGVQGMLLCSTINVGRATAQKPWIF